MAFDRVDHTAMLNALRRMGVTKPYLNILEDLYTGASFTVSGMGQPPAHGHCSAGIRQGCPLSPYLFVIVMSVIMDEVESLLKEQGVPLNTWSKYKSGFDLEYADDTLLMGQTIPQLQSIFSAVETVSSRYGLLLNKDKTVLLRCYESPMGSLDHTANITFSDSTPVKNITEGHTIYLGAAVHSNGRQLPNLNVRLGKASQEFKKLSNVWNSDLHDKLKLRIFMSIFPPMITYSLQTCTLLAVDRAKIDSWFYRHIRKVLRIKASYISRISNELVAQRAGIEHPLSHFVDKFTLKLLSSLLFSPTDDPLYHVSLTAACQDKVAIAHKPSRGRPRDHWLKRAIKLASQHLPSAAPDPASLRAALKKEGARKRLVEAPTRARTRMA